MRSRQDGRRRAVGRAAGAEQAGFAEQIDIRQAWPALSVQTGLDATCSGARHKTDHIAQASAGATAMSISANRNASCAGAISVSQECSLICLLQHLAVERMMQRQRPARQQPDHQR